MKRDTKKAPTSQMMSQLARILKNLFPDHEFLCDLDTIKSLRVKEQKRGLLEIICSTNDAECIVIKVKLCELTDKHKISAKKFLFLLSKLIHEFKFLEITQQPQNNACPLFIQLYLPLEPVSYLSSGKIVNDLEILKELAINMQEECHVNHQNLDLKKKYKEVSDFLEPVIAYNNNHNK